MLFCLLMYLKSNMDRFIAKTIKIFFAVFMYLKSNMDRFIAHWTIKNNVTINGFKIQYG